ncbi:N-acetyl-L-ornithine deacetylase ArgE [Shewanella corallii]|uniref:N-acetyl-L-ornithine deacetylase ArgE n=1 Tax=Shewanella corallii TaxID=560080 RepID=A0ABT0N5Y4_9GAMM|nr:N-acetyl-L-ornithine deacetylase ArgE [Shewanella corallii]MCL2913851.1 N-acetyl-L-ornithine deacetylase ArgE [Shewanella corallii]
MRSPFQSFLWQSGLFACDSNDLEHFSALLSEETQRLGMKQTLLGEAGRFPLPMFKSPAPNADLPSILVCAGFHGDAAAGPWGILYWLASQSEDIFTQVNLSILPLVSASGFRKGQKYNRQGQDALMGYLWEQGKAKTNDDTSEEGEILLRHGQLLQAAGRDGVLTLGEDVHSEQAYLCSFEPRQAPGAFTGQLLESLGEHFPLKAQATSQACDVGQGNLFNCFDSSFTAFLVKAGARCGAAIYTPAGGDFDDRVKATAHILDGFVGRYLQLPEAADVY